MVLTPEPPVADWLAALDSQMKQSPSVFEARPVIVDMSGLPRGTDLTAVVDALMARDLRIIGVEGADPDWTDGQTWGRTPMMSTSRADRFYEVTTEVADVPALPKEPSALVLTRPVRSGQSVTFMQGDVTIVGSVASGAEVIAGGSIHVYGALRGRAVAGLLGQPGARIFCRRLDAELLAIDGIYKTADDIEPELRGRAVQAWLDGEAVMLAALD
nr:septum site-determining protein MinC [Limobrevibacterium gyesilva]